MLAQAILSKPPTKFILIQDTYAVRQNALLESIIKMQRSNNPTTPLHICTFENHLQNKIPGDPCTKYHEMPSNPDFLPVDLNKISTKSILVIDSIADLIYNHGEAKCLQELKKVSNHKSVLQIIGVLHTDLIGDQKLIPKYFAALSTLDIVAHNFDIVDCTHKRPFGKVVKKTLKVTFNGNGFVTKEINLNELKLAELRISADQTPVASINPENLSTFKIGLEANEIQSRNQLVLPYLRTEEKGKPLVTIGGSSIGGKILYMPDDNDDFDEEDPDDDLNI